VGKQKAHCVVNAGNPTVGHVANAGNELTRRVAMPVKFISDFQSKQSGFNLKSRSMKDKLGPKALRSGSQLY